MSSVTLVRLLFSNHPRADLGRVTDPQFVSLLYKHPLEPMRVTSGFHPHAGGSWKSRVKGPGFSGLVFQPALNDFAGLGIQHRDLLEARMKITAYNQHTRLLSSEPWSGQHRQVYSAGRSRRRYPIKIVENIGNQNSGQSH